MASLRLKRSEIDVSCVIYLCGMGGRRAVAREFSLVDISMKVGTSVGVDINARRGVGKQKYPIQP